MGDIGEERTLSLNVVTPKPIATGTPEYEQKRSKILAAFAKNVPSNLRLEASFFNHPPRDVSTVPATCGLLTAEELSITEKYDAVGLAQAIAARTLTSVQVATAFSKRAIIAHQVTCCLTDWFMDEAIKQAQDLDDYLVKHGKPIGPLHGVPISIKEHMSIAGRSASEGCIISTYASEEDCYMVSILRAAGAVFYCKTNQPQGIMHLESTSHFGRTLNPFNTDLSAGGSSGGEAALVAMKGSVLGVGTDIGGSIRGPSAFCGIYGFKPTSDVLPLKGMLSHPLGAELNVQGATGPMCRTLRDMNFFCKIVLDAKPWLLDPRVVPIPWTGLEQIPKKPLKIGIVEHDGFITPQPPVRRAIAWLRERLSNPKFCSLVQVKAFEVYGAAEASSLVRRAYWPDGGTPLKDIITAGGEPIHPLTEWVTKDAEVHGMLSAEDVTDLRWARDKFRHAFAASWEDQDVDFIISPAFVGPASAHDTALYWTYTSLYNLVDYPGAVFPTPIKVEGGEKYAEDYVPLGEECNRVKEMWEASNFEGAPIDVQIVARRFHDNELFGAMETLKEVLELP